jgi:SAM-dependent methyltransferase
VSDTLNYYNQNADSFFADTAAVDMSQLYGRFLLHIPKGGLLLDAGCGSGRDSKAFLGLGYRVRAFDASHALAQRTSTFINQPVATLTFDQIDETACYDGVWACASLLHLSEVALPAALGRLWTALKPGCTFYMSFKWGQEERTHNGRHFTDATEERLRTWIAKLNGVDAVECWITQDQRPGRQECWLNALVQREESPRAKLVTGERDHLFLPHLCGSIAKASEIDFTVAFIKASGLRLLLPDLQGALTHGEDGCRAPARVYESATIYSINAHNSAS